MSEICADKQFSPSKLKVKESDLVVGLVLVAVVGMDRVRLVSRHQQRPRHRGLQTPNSLSNNSGSRQPGSSDLELALSWMQTSEGPLEGGGHGSLRTLTPALLVVEAHRHPQLRVRLQASQRVAQTHTAVYVPTCQPEHTPPQPS